MIIFLIGCAAGQAALTPEQKAKRELKLQELLRAGNRSLRLGDWDNLDHAQSAYTLARELSPEDPRVIDGLGCVAWRKGNAEQAEFYFRRAAELNRAYDRPVAHLALVAEQRGHTVAAKELLQRALQLNPLNFKARNNLAATLMRGDEHLADAQRELLKAYELAGPEDPVVGFNLNELQQRKGW